MLRGADDPKEHLTIAANGPESREGALLMTGLGRGPGTLDALGQWRPQSRPGLSRVAAGQGEAGSLVELAAQVEHGQTGDRAQAQQNAPGDAGGHVRGEEDRGDERTHDEAGSLHREDQPDHASTRLRAEYSLMMVALTG